MTTPCFAGQPGGATGLGHRLESQRPDGDTLSIMTKVKGSYDEAQLAELFANRANDHDALPELEALRDAQSNPAG